MSKRSIANKISSITGDTLIRSLSSSSPTISSRPSFRHYIKHSPSFLQQRRNIFTANPSHDPAFFTIIPANYLSLLDSLSIPWLLILPLTAITVRTALYPYCVRGRQRVNAKLIMFQPLIDAQMSHDILRSVVHSKSGQSMQKSPGMKLRSWIKIKWSRWRVGRYFEKEFGVRSRKWSVRILSLVILLIVSEGLRRVCGLREGLVGLLLGRFKPYLAGEEARRLNEDHESSNYRTLNDNHVIPLEHNNLQSFITSRVDYKEGTSWLLPSLRNGGLPWSEDLTSPDKYKILPLLFSGSLFYSLWTAQNEAERQRTEQNTSSPEKTQTGEAKVINDEKLQVKKAPDSKYTWQKGFISIVSGLSLIPAWDMPCALLIYFISNLAIGKLQSQHVMLKYPVIRPPQACKTRARLMTSQVQVKR